VSERTGFVAKKRCKPLLEKTQTTGSHGPATEHMAQPVKNISLYQVGCEARKIPAEGDVFFLDFYLYRTYQELAAPARRMMSR
ncbi:MAG: hypothetical protein WB470_13075, partial [Candidatus Acidiferrales bacterium]